MKYRSDIDGLRALAVLPVVAFHAGIAGVPGGFVGVDIFFVISGFLITAIIVADVEAGRFSIAGFYERRVRRILPNLFAMMAATLAVCLVVLIPADLAYFGQTLTAAALSASNILFWIKTGYFDANASQVPLLHTWSLAVEEQYYILFPPLIALVVGRLKVRPAPVIWALFAASLAVSVWQVRASPTGAFYLPFGRWWELMTGSLLAVGAVPPIHGARRREIAAAAGLAAILVAIATFHEQMRFPGEAALLPCLGTAAVIHANRHGPTAVGRLLSWRPFVLVGLVSYSLYLWHWPVIVLARYLLQRAPTAPETIVLIAIMAALAIGAWRFVERPLRRARHGWTQARILALALAGTLGFAAIGVALWRTAGLPQRYPPAIRAYALAAGDVNSRRVACDNPSLARVAAGDVCRLGAAAGPARFAFVGDSYADAMAPGVDAAARRTGVPGLVITHPGCLPLVGASGCTAFWRAAYARLAADPAIDTVIVAARWPTFVEGRRFGLFEADWRLVTDALSTRSDPDENRAAIARSFDRTAAALRGKRFVVLAGMPEQRVHAPQYLTLRSLWGGSLAGLPRAAFDARQARTQALIGAAARRDGFAVVDAATVMCGPADCPIAADGAALYADDSHPSTRGAVRFARVLDPVIGDSAR